MPNIYLQRPPVQLKTDYNADMNAHRMNQAQIDQMNSQNTYRNTLTSEERRKLLDEQNVRNAANAYMSPDMQQPGNPGQLNNMQQYTQDQGITPMQQTAGMNQAIQGQQANPQVAARKQALSNAAIMAVTAPTDAEFEQTKMSLYKSAVASGMDLSSHGINSEADVKKLTRADMASWVMDPKVIEEIGKKRMEMLGGDKLSPEQQLLRRSISEKKGIPLSQVSATDIIKAENEQAQKKREINMTFNGLNAAENAALDRAISNGLDPYRVNSRTAKIYAQQEIQNPGRPWNELGAQASFQRNQSTSQTKALLNTIDPLLDKLDQTGKSLGNMQSPAANKVVNWYKSNISGDANLTAFKNLRDDTVAEIERGLLNTGVLSDSKYNRAIKNVSEAGNYQQLKAAIANTRTVIHARLDALATGPYPNARAQSQGNKVGRFTVEEVK